MDLSGWSDAQLHKALGDLIHERSGGGRRAWALAGIFALILLGAGQLVLVLERATWWECAIIAAGVVGAFLARQHDRHVMGQSRFLDDVKAEIDRRDPARP